MQQAQVLAFLSCGLSEEDLAAEYYQVPCFQEQEESYAYVTSLAQPLAEVDHPQPVAETRQQKYLEEQERWCRHKTALLRAKDKQIAV